MMSEANLFSLGGNHLPGLDIGQVERERKEMWRKMFQKYEDMEESEEFAEEVALEDIDKPETVNSIYKGQLQSCQMQPSSTLKQYFMEHAEEIDEIATIAGETVSDEEVLSDDSDDELLYSESDAPNNVVDGEADIIGNNQLPLTPATSEDDQENSDVGENGNNDQDDDDIDATLSELNEDNSETIVESDEDDDLLYTAGPQPESKNIFHQFHPASASQEPMNKKQRLKPPPSPIKHPSEENIYVTGENVISQNVTPRPVDEVPSSENNIQVSAQEVTTREAVEDDTNVDKNTQQKHLECSHCLTSTFYKALPVSDEFLCDECMAGDHLHCEVEECRVCREVGEIISLRRQAEVFGRIQKSNKL